MSAKTNHFKIGLFVLAAVALLILGLLAFGARSYFEPKITFETFVEGSVDGLSLGSPVKLRGVPMGAVTRIGFAWNEYPGTTNAYITVEFQVEKRLTPISRQADPQATLAAAIKRGLRAIVKSQGITGTSFVSLEMLDPEQNSPPPIDFTPRHNYIPSAPSQFTKMLDSIEESLNSFRRVDFGAINKGVTNLLEVVSHFAQKLDEIELKKLSSDADAMLNEFKAAGVKVQDGIEDVRKTLRGMNLEGLGTNANVLVVGLQESNAKLQTVLDHLGAAPVSQTVSDLRRALHTLDGVLQELKQYPSGFFLGKPPAPARGVRNPRQ
jgi:ABC-type transporter Mla subunit MlaD